LRHPSVCKRPSSMASQIFRSAISRIASIIFIVLLYPVAVFFLNGLLQERIIMLTKTLIV
jgi:hypothetical protein